MKSLLAIFLVATALYCVGQTPDTFKVEPLPFPRPASDQSSFSIDSLVAIADELDPIIGRFPPSYPETSDRATTYRKWSEAVLALESKSDDDSELAFILKARLYRQGHNMDVVDSGRKADKAIKAGLEKYPESIPINFQASYFYLQINPKYAPEGEKALLRLRRLLDTDKNLEVERGLVFAYLYQNKIKQAKKQIDRCLKIDPHDEMLQRFREALKSGKIKRISN